MPKLITNPEILIGRRLTAIRIDTQESKPILCLHSNELAVAFIAEPRYQNNNYIDFYAIHESKLTDHVRFGLGLISREEYLMLQSELYGRTKMHEHDRQKRKLLYLELKKEFEEDPREE